MHSDALISGVRCAARSRPEAAFLVLVPAILLFFALHAAIAAPAVSPETITIEFIQNSVEVLRAGARTWDVVSTNQSHNMLHPGDELRTGDNSRAALRLPAQKSTIILDSNSRFLVPSAPQSPFEVLRGRLFNFHRGPSGEQRFKTPTVSAIVRGTDFSLKVEDDATTTVSMLAGEVSLENSFGRVDLKSGEEGIAKTGEAPRRTAVITMATAIQWCLYYPAVLDPSELPLTNEEKQSLGPSLASYHAGDLVQALALMPRDWQTGSRAKQLYAAAVLLSVGNVEEARMGLASIEASRRGEPDQRLSRLATGIQQMISLVSLEVATLVASNRETDLLATGSLVESYRFQAGGELETALAFARRAAEANAEFSHAWVRVAELEFSFGRVAQARAALSRALRLGPRHAQGAALQGFILSAENNIDGALAQFERAIELDGKLANGWLGRGLCLFRKGEKVRARDDLQMAATVEPQRALLRSYLGKAWSESGLPEKAETEIAIAQELDPRDPTAWLYSALIKRQNNQISSAVRDLEKSIDLNDNRAVYRSRLLLDEDRAVRSASLAKIYQDASLDDVAQREAAKAVSYDYANHGAHQFLAESYNTLRDPTRFNLRYETVWFNELLLANLLSPGGVGLLSQNVSQQEYTRLFERDRFGLFTSTEIRTDGQYRETASQYGSINRFSYTLDLDYQHNNGVRPNNELDRIEWYSTLKYEISPQDSLMFLAKYQDYDSGDNFQYYDPSSARTNFQYSESQKPGMLMGGYHREWGPGIHTLLLGGRLMNEQQLGDSSADQTIAVVNPVGVVNPRVVPFDVSYQSRFEIYSAELNQVFQREKHTDILGARFQKGTFDANARLDNPPPPFSTNGGFALPDLSTTDADYQRLSVYAYHHWEMFDGFLLIAGLAYDDLRFPANFRRPPLNSDESTDSQVSPKAALVWDLTPRLRARAVYAQALGGVSYDESVRLEPTQLAGFSQSFRSLISESLVGSVEAPRYEIIGGAFDLRPWTNAWLSLQGEVLRERVDREIGIFNFNFGNTPPATPATTREQLDYHEFNGRVTFHQIVARDWFLEAQYQFSRSELARTLPDIAATPGYARTMQTEADLHQFKVAATWRHPSGFFARGEWWWFIQDLSGSNPGDSFPQLNLFAGYNFWRRRADVTFGLLNATGEDYQLSPLNYYAELPRERVFYTRLRFNF